MRVILITIPRCGSVSLLHGLSKSLLLKEIGEPFNNKLWKTQPNVNISNVVVKTFIDQLPSDNLDSIEFYQNLSQKFDKVIIVTRKNLIEASESYAYNQKYSDIDGWANKYFIHDTNLETTPILKSYIRNDLKLKKLGKLINTKVDYYEDLFSGNKSIIENFLEKHELDLNFDILFKYLNPKNRYRQFKPILI